MPCIYGSDGKFMVTTEETIKVWKEYEEKLLNKENDCNRELKMENVKGPSKRVSLQHRKVRECLKQKLKLLWKFLRSELLDVKVGFHLIHSTNPSRAELHFFRIAMFNHTPTITIFGPTHLLKLSGIESFPHPYEGVG